MDLHRDSGRADRTDAGIGRRRRGGINNPTDVNILVKRSMLASSSGIPFAAAIEQVFDSRFRAKSAPPTASLLRDMPDGKAVEAEAILGDLVRRRDSIDTPLLDIAYLHMKSYLARRNRTT